MELHRKKFNNIQEAEAALSQSVVEHSKRVEQYAMILFLEACEEEIHRGDQKAVARLKEDNRYMIETIAKYHDIGKAFISDDYQDESEDFSAEELALYKKHAHDSVILMQTYYFIEHETRQFERNCIVEAIGSHHERWDGTGYPSGLRGSQIPILARIFAIADELDHKVCEIHSETPFDDAYAKMIEMFDHAFDPVLQTVFENTKSKLRKVYKANIQHTRTIPEVDMFVKRTKTRPMFLMYRPIARRRTEEVRAYIAQAVFPVKEGIKTYAEMERIIKQGKILVDLGLYFVYEACDMLNRLSVCEIPCDRLYVKMLYDWIKQPGVASKVITACDEAQISHEKISFILGGKRYKEATAGELKNVAKLKAAGFKFACYDQCPTQINIDKLIDAGVDTVFLSDSPEFAIENDDTERYIKSLGKNDIRVYADDIPKEKIKDLEYFGIEYMCSPSLGDYMREDKVIELGLAAINE